MFVIYFCLNFGMLQMLLAFPLISFCETFLADLGISGRLAFLPISNCAVLWIIIWTTSIYIQYFASAQCNIIPKHMMGCAWTHMEAFAFALLWRNSLLGSGAVLTSRVRLLCWVVQTDEGVFRNVMQEPAEVNRQDLTMHLTHESSTHHNADDLLLKVLYSMRSAWPKYFLLWTRHWRRVKGSAAFSLYPSHPKPAFHSWLPRKGIGFVRNDALLLI